MDPVEKLRKEAKGCRACPLWENATQAIEEEKEAAFRQFVADLGLIREALAVPHPG